MVVRGEELTEKIELPGPSLPTPDGYLNFYDVEGNHQMGRADRICVILFDWDGICGGDYV